MAIPFLAIVREDSADAVKKWVKTHDLSWTILLDPKNKAAVEFATTGQPETYAVNKNGVIVAQQLGASFVNDFKQLKTCAMSDENEACVRK